MKSHLAPYEDHGEKIIPLSSNPFDSGKHCSTGTDESYCDIAL